MEGTHKEHGVQPPAPHRSAQNSDSTSERVVQPLLELQQLRAAPAAPWRGTFSRFPGQDLSVTAEGFQAHSPFPRRDQTAEGSASSRNARTRPGAASRSPPRCDPPRGARVPTRRPPAPPRRTCSYFSAARQTGPLASALPDPACSTPIGRLPPFPRPAPHRSSPGELAFPARPARRPARCRRGPPKLLWQRSGRAAGPDLPSPLSPRPAPAAAHRGPAARGRGAAPSPGSGGLVRAGWP